MLAEMSRFLYTGDIQVVWKPTLQYIWMQNKHKFSQPAMNFIHQNGRWHASHGLVHHRNANVVRVHFPFA